jgi:hypothetical protein
MPLPPLQWQGGGTSLSFAAGNGHEAVLQLLLESKADANVADQVSHRSSLTDRCNCPKNLLT